MNKYLVTIEFRYNGTPSEPEGYSRYIEKTLTIGVFDSRDEANQAGNVALIEFEKQFKLNPNWNRKERFSNNGGCFGYPKDLISDMGYLETPFEFFAKITKLNYGDVNDYIKESIKEVKAYRKWKNAN